jgi:hypothetical protein
VVEVAVADDGRLARRLQPLGGVLADRLQHPEALVCAPQQALVDQRLQRVEVGLADLLRRLERAATAEDRQPREELPLLR